MLKRYLALLLVPPLLLPSLSAEGIALRANGLSSDAFLTEAIVAGVLAARLGSFNLRGTLARLKETRNRAQIPAASDEETLLRIPEQALEDLVFSVVWQMVEDLHQELSQEWRFTQDSVVGFKKIFEHWFDGSIDREDRLAGAVRMNFKRNDKAAIELTQRFGTIEAAYGLFDSALADHWDRETLVRELRTLKGLSESQIKSYTDSFFLKKQLLLKKHADDPLRIREPNFHRVAIGGVFAVIITLGLAFYLFGSDFIGHLLEMFHRAPANTAPAGAWTLANIGLTGIIHNTIRSSNDSSETPQETALRNALVQIRRSIEKDESPYPHVLETQIPLGHPAYKILTALKGAHPFHGALEIRLPAHPPVDLSRAALYVLQELQRDPSCLRSPVFEEFDETIRAYNQKRKAFRIPTPPLTTRLLFSYVVSPYVGPAYEPGLLAYVKALFLLPGALGQEVPLFHLLNQSAHKLKWEFARSQEYFDVRATSILMNGLLDLDQRGEFRQPEIARQFEWVMVFALWRSIRFPEVRAILHRFNPARFLALTEARLRKPGFAGAKGLNFTAILGTWVMHSKFSFLALPVDDIWLNPERPTFNGLIELLLLTRDVIEDPYLDQDSSDDPKKISPLDHLRQAATLQPFLDLLADGHPEDVLALMEDTCKAAGISLDDIYDNPISVPFSDNVHFKESESPTNLWFRSTILFHWLYLHDVLSGELQERVPAHTVLTRMSLKVPSSLAFKNFKPVGEFQRAVLAHVSNRVNRLFDELKGPDPKKALTEFEIYLRRYNAIADEDGWPTARLEIADAVSLYLSRLDVPDVIRARLADVDSFPFELRQKISRFHLQVQALHAIDHQIGNRNEAIDVEIVSNLLNRVLEALDQRKVDGEEQEGHRVAASMAMIYYGSFKSVQEVLARYPTQDVRPWLRDLLHRDPRNPVSIVGAKQDWGTEMIAVPRMRRAMSVLMVDPNSQESRESFSQIPQDLLRFPDLTKRGPEGQTFKDERQGMMITADEVLKNLDRAYGQVDVNLTEPANAERSPVRKSASLMTRSRNLLTTLLIGAVALLRSITDAPLTLQQRLQTAS